MSAIMLMAVPLWAQTGSTDSQQQQPVPPLVGTNTGTASADANNDTANTNSDRMQAPPPVSGQTYPTVLTSQERSNYIRGGLSFTTPTATMQLGSSRTVIL